MKKTIIIGLSLIACIFAQAQEPAQYIHFNIGGGAHNLSYNMPNGTQTGKAGFTLNGAYSYFFTPNWGVQAGLGIQSFGATSKLNYFTAAPDIDSDGDAFEFRTQYTNWEEKQNVLFIEIPLAAQYRYAINDKFGLIGSLGAKMSLPVYSKYKTFAGQIRTTGYYEQWNVELSDLPEEGYQTYTNSFSDKLSLKPAFMGLVDLGGLYRLTHNMELYVGGYLNYGLNSVNKPDTKLILQRDGVYNGIFASNQVTAIKPVSFGLKVGLYFQLGKQKPEIKVIEAVEPVLPVITPEPEQPQDSVLVIEETPVIVDVPKVEEKAPVIVVPPKTEVKKPKPVDNFKAAQAMASSIKIRFDMNSCQPISKVDNEKLKSLVKYLKANPKANLQIIGHTCDTGTRRNNMKLGTQRAIEIQQRLIKLGAQRAQLVPLSKAYDEPLVPNTTEANRTKNRRVEFRLVKK